MNEKLIYDIGIHNGQDTFYYLKRGFNVVALDANPDLIKSNSLKFAKYLDAKRLDLIHRIVSDAATKTRPFHISKISEWSSLNYDIANRFYNFQSTEEVETISLAELVTLKGVPYYCKVDIEGEDLNALKSLKLNQRPKFVSLESECSVNESTCIYDTFDMIQQLKSMGYSKFKLVDQHDLKPVNFPVKNKTFLKISFLNRFKKYYLALHPYKIKLLIKFGHYFSFGSSGPFGDDIEGEWYDAITIKSLTKELKRIKPQGEHSFWYDIHATY